MVERRSELRRTRTRRAKVTKLKARLTKAKTPGERELIVKKIQRISPFWKEPKAPAAAPAAAK